MDTFARVFALLVVLTLAAQGEPLSSPPNRIVLPADVVPERYDIKVRPNAEALTFTGQVEIAISVQRATDRIVLNAADLTIGRTSLSGRSETPKVVLDEHTANGHLRLRDTGGARSLRALHRLHG